MTEEGVNVNFLYVYISEICEMVVLCLMILVLDQLATFLGFRFHRKFTKCLKYLGHPEGGKYHPENYCLMNAHVKRHLA